MSYAKLEQIVTNEWTRLEADKDTHAESHPDVWGQESVYLEGAGPAALKGRCKRCINHKRMMGYFDKQTTDAQLCVRAVFDLDRYGLIKAARFTSVQKSDLQAAFKDGDAVLDEDAKTLTWTRYREKRDEDGNGVKDSAGEPVLEPYTKTYDLSLPHVDSL